MVTVAVDSMSIFSTPMPIGKYEGYDQVQDLIVPDSSREDPIENIANIKQRLSDAVVLMSVMRTMLVRTTRTAMNDSPRPWVTMYRDRTAGHGKQCPNSVHKAIIVGLMEGDDQ